MFKSKNQFSSWFYLHYSKSHFSPECSLSEALAVNFFLLTMFFFVAWLVGLIKPSFVLRWGGPSKKTRKNVSKFYLVSMLLSFILFIILLPKSSPLEQAFDNQAQKNSDVLATFEYQTETDSGTASCFRIWKHFGIYIRSYIFAKTLNF